MGGALPAALSALHEWAGGRTIDTLAGALRLSHSRTVRVIDRSSRPASRGARATRPTGAACWSTTPAGHAAARASWRRARPRSNGATPSRGRRAALARARRGGAGPGTTTGSARGRGDLPVMRCARVRPPRRALSRHARGRRRRAGPRRAPSSVRRRDGPFRRRRPRRGAPCHERAAGGPVCRRRGDRPTSWREPRSRAGRRGWRNRPIYGTLTGFPAVV